LMVRAWSDKKLASVTNTAIRKIESVLPEKLKADIHLQDIIVPGFQMTELASLNLGQIREAIGANSKLKIEYRSLKDEVTTRTIWPLLLYFWGNKWTLGAYCEVRSGFRSFRIDLIQMLEATGGFEPDDVKFLNGYNEYQQRYGGENG
jgi:predicted DNA-binding transcriptional regulator YafY